jgi:hypothetical protein
LALRVAQRRRAVQHQQTLLVTDLIVVGAVAPTRVELVDGAAERLAAEQRPELPVAGLEPGRMLGGGLDIDLGGVDHRSGPRAHSPAQ